jgi:hypothetical protein
VVTLTETGGSIDLPVELQISDLTLVPLEPPSDYDCLHVANVTMARD